MEETLVAAMLEGRGETDHVSDSLGATVQLFIDAHVDFAGSTVI